jgi:outer membrane protein OmpU
MKKILFVTTALIATASVAAAEVRISGYGRFGIDYNDDNDRAVNGVSSTNITSRLRLQFDMSTETDSGVSFGARFRAQAESRDNAPGGATFNGARFFASYEGFQLLVGNIIGAIENTPGLYLETRTADIGVDGAGFESVVANVNSGPGGGALGTGTNEGFNWDYYSSGGAGNNGVEVIYSANGFVGHLSYSTDNGVNSIDRFGIMGSYNFGDWTVALSAQQSDILWEDKVIFTVAGDLGQFGVRFAYADNDGIRKVGLYGNMDIGAAGNLVAYVTDEDAVDAADVAAGRNNNVDGAGVRGALTGTGGVFTNTEGSGYGINYSYDLGGGATFIAGYRRASNDNNTAQAGVYFSF